MVWLFQSLNHIYEGQFTARYKDANDAMDARRFWGQVLGKVTERQLMDALSRCLREFPTFPPKPGEFLRLCMPDANYYLNAFQEARNNAVLRLARQEVRWTHPAIYWAAVRFGYADLAASSWAQAQARWKVHFDAELEKGEAIDPIPVHREALPVPGRTTTTMEEGRKRMAAIKAMLQSAKQ